MTKTKRKFIDLSFTLGAVISVPFIVEATVMKPTPTVSEFKQFKDYVEGVDKNKKENETLEEAIIKDMHSDKVFTQMSFDTFETTYSDKEVVIKDQYINLIGREAPFGAPYVDITDIDKITFINSVITSTEATNITSESKGYEIAIENSIITPYFRSNKPFTSISVTYGNLNIYPTNHIETFDINYGYKISNVNEVVDGWYEKETVFNKGTVSNSYVKNGKL